MTAVYPVAGTPYGYRYHPTRECFMLVALDDYDHAINPLGGYEEEWEAWLAARRRAGLTFA